MESLILLARILRYTLLAHAYRLTEDSCHMAHAALWDWFAEDQAYTESVSQIPSKSVSD